MFFPKTNLVDDLNLTELHFEIILLSLIHIQLDKKKRGNE